MANGSVGYSLTHLQLGTTVATVTTWVDVPGSQTWEPSIDAPDEDIKADGQNYVTVYGAPIGSGNVTFIDGNLAVMAGFNGGTVATAGTGPTKIDTYKVYGSYVPPVFSLADWVPNVDKGHNPGIAGMRTVAPTVTAKPLTRSSGQESIVTWSADTKFVGVGTAPMLVYETLAAAPTMTSGVYDYTLPTT